MVTLESELDALATASGFSGAVRVDRGDRIELAKAYGLAHRGYEIPNEIDTRFGLASGTKGLTALTVVSLIEEGRFELSTPARALLGTDLPLIEEGVTVEHLLAHRSGIGDYLDEDVGVDLDEYLMPVPVHELATTEQYLAALDGHPPKFAPGERFAYCNSGYVVLALIAERASGVAFHELVRQRVCEPAGMGDTEFLRSDELPGRTALGYLERDGVWRTNVFHLPVRGSGDGGIYSTVADIRSLWSALFAGGSSRSTGPGRCCEPGATFPPRRCATASGSGSTPRRTSWCSKAWTPESRSGPCTTRNDTTHTVVSNSTAGAWPVTRHLAEHLGT